MNIENGKSFQIFCAFVNAIKSGKKSIMFGTNYVVLDKKSYNTLVADHERKSSEEIWWEEEKCTRGTVKGQADF